MRVAVLVDGFNIYHSLCDAINAGAPAEVKWSNLKAICSSHLSAFNNRDAHFSELFYFTSIASYRPAAAISRHRAYIRALESLGFTTIYGNFKDKTVRCEASCKQEYVAHVEKQSDVNIALKLLEVFLLDTSDAALVISGDGDLINAVRTARRLFPQKIVAVAFPYQRWHSELSLVASVRIKLAIDDYKNNILPNPIQLASGKLTHMPNEWKK